jgi:bilirubin oxidase
MKHFILVFCFLLTSLVAFNQGTYSEKFKFPLDIPPILQGEEIDLVVGESTHEFFKNQFTNTYGVNGSYLGPTILMQKGDSIKINVTNHLNAHTTMHWHGFHVPAKFDGGPHTTIHPGETWSPKFKVLDQAATYWYHPHPHGLTTQQVTLGLMGLIIVQDEEEAALELPRTYGVDDIPMIVQSKSFLVNSKQIAPLGAETHFLVNSTVYPFQEVPRQLVRLRLMNGSNLRVVNLGFSDHRTFYQISSDGGLLPAPVPLTQIKLSTGERADILVDFSDLEQNTVMMVNYALDLPIGTPGTLFTAAPSILDITNTSIIEFRGIAATADAIATIPDRLLENDYEIWAESEADVTRYFKMEVNLLELITSGFINGFSFDNQLFDHHVVNHVAKINDVEIWEIYNNTPFSHPFHIHDQQFYILDRNGLPPPENERGRKDVVLVNQYERVRFIAKFTDFADDHYTYMYHCHILSHEDEGMMGQFLVLSPEMLTTHFHSSIPLVNIYPNPSAGFIKIDLPHHTAGHLSYKIYNMKGAVVLLGDIDLNTTIFTSQLASGEYIVNLMEHDKIIGRAAFIQQ